MAVFVFLKEFIGLLVLALWGVELEAHFITTVRIQFLPQVMAKLMIENGEGTLHDPY